jgi:hypothetical protein
MIETERERGIGIGEDYLEPEIPFGECWTSYGWIHDGEMEIFAFKYNFQTFFEHYNFEAELNGW